MSLKILLIAFLGYCVSVVIAFGRAERNGPAVRGIVPLVLGGVLAVVTIQSSAGLIYAAAALNLLFFWAVPIPFIVFGLGQLTGSLASYLPMRPLGMLARALVIAAPVVGISAFYLDQRAERAERRAVAVAKMAEFHLTSLDFVLSGKKLHVPATPQAMASHACSGRDGTRRTNCSTHFWRAIGLRYQDGIETPVPLEELSLRAIGTCKGCLSPEDHAAWCARRPDKVETVWCRAQPTFGVRFQDAPSLADWHFGYESWTEVPVAREAVSLFCQDAHNGTRCQALYVLADDVHASVWMPLADREQAQRDAIEMYEYTLGIWQDISRP